MVLKLYKNDKLELSLKGIKEEEKCLFDNIIYDTNKNLLIREDNDFKYTLDFNKKGVMIELKEYNQLLKMILKNVEIKISKKGLRVKYIIETEESILNEIEINF